MMRRIWLLSVALVKTGPFKTKTKLLKEALHPGCVIAGKALEYYRIKVQSGDYWQELVIPKPEQLNLNWY